MLAFLVVALIVFFVTSGIFLTIEAGRRNRNFAMMQARESHDPIEAESSSEPEMPRAA